jgi:hypothetical protein
MVFRVQNDGVQGLECTMRATMMGARPHHSKVDIRLHEKGIETPMAQGRSTEII